MVTQVEFSVICAANVGNVRVLITTTGVDVDDGYTISVDDAAPRAIAVNGSVLLDSLRVGTHTVTLGDVEKNCGLLQINPLTVQVTLAFTIDLAFRVQCFIRPGALRVAVSTTGDSLDADGYNVTVRQGSFEKSSRVDVNGVVTFEDLPPNSYTVTLGDVAANCPVTGGSVQGVPVASKQTIDITFAAECTRLGNFHVTAATTGAAPIPERYGVEIVGGQLSLTRSDSLWSNGSLTLQGLFPGDYDLNLGMSLACDAGDAVPTKIRVTAGATVDLALAVVCSNPTAQLAFMRNRDLYVVNANGTGLTRVATGAGQPSWSPDGSAIAVRTFGTGNEDINIIPLSGASRIRVTDFAARDNNPSWSPDGNRVVFVTEWLGNPSILVALLDDPFDFLRLSRGDVIDTDPDWSPDGTRIVFRRTDASSVGIFVMDAITGNATRLTSDGSEPAWSPDGSKIAFSRRVDGRSNIFVMNVDGSGATRFESAFNDYQPAWFPDGRWITFVTDRCRDNVCTGDARCRERRRLSTKAAPDPGCGSGFAGMAQVTSARSVFAMSTGDSATSEAIPWPQRRAETRQRWLARSRALTPKPGTGSPRRSCGANTRRRCMLGRTRSSWMSR